MAAVKPTIGTQHALDLRDSSVGRSITPADAEKRLSLQHALEKLEQSALVDSQQLAMMRTTAGHLSQCIDRSVDCLQVAELPKVITKFRQYLKAKFPKGNSARSYLHYLRWLIRLAAEQGWTDKTPEIPEEWIAIYAVAIKAGCGQIVRYAVEQGKHPEEFGDMELEAWGNSALAAGTHLWKCVRQAQSKFRRTVLRGGLASLMPRLSHPEQLPTIGVPVEKFLPKIRQEAEEMIGRKLSPTALSNERIGTQTAKNLRRTLGYLYGYAVLKQINPQTIDDLLSEQVVKGYVDWYVIDRKNQASSLRPKLGGVYAAYKQYRKKQLEWFSELLRGIAPEPRWALRERRARKSLEYDLATEIPDRMQALTEQQQFPVRVLALLKRNQLIEQFLCSLAWRRRNLCEAELAPRDEGGNVFKEELRYYETCARAPWVDEALRNNPHEEFWQALFRPDEHKTGPRKQNLIHMIIPQELAARLADYVQNYRPILLGTSPTRALFVSEHGTHLGGEQISTIVNNLTFRYGGKRMPPHLHRASLAVQFLKDDPRGLLQLSNLFWHSDPETTRKLYAEDFDESYGVVAAEEWLEGRKSKRLQGPAASARCADLFARLRSCAVKISDNRARVSIMERINELEQAVGKPSLASKYGEFVACLGVHISLFAPLLPALTAHLMSSGHDAR